MLSSNTLAAIRDRAYRRLGSRGSDYAPEPDRPKKSDRSESAYEETTGIGTSFGRSVSAKRKREKFPDEKTQDKPSEANQVFKRRKRLVLSAKHPVRFDEDSAQTKFQTSKSSDDLSREISCVEHERSSSEQPADREGQFWFLSEKARSDGSVKGPRGTEEEGNDRSDEGQGVCKTTPGFIREPFRAWPGYLEEQSHDTNGSDTDSDPFTGWKRRECYTPSDLSCETLDYADDECKGEEIDSSGVGEGSFHQSPGVVDSGRFAPHGKDESETKETKTKTVSFEEGTPTNAVHARRSPYVAFEISSGIPATVQRDGYTNGNGDAKCSIWLALMEKLIETSKGTNPVITPKSFSLYVTRVRSENSSLSLQKIEETGKEILASIDARLVQEVSSRHLEAVKVSYVSVERALSILPKKSIRGSVLRVINSLCNPGCILFKCEAFRVLSTLRAVSKILHPDFVGPCEVYEFSDGCLLFLDLARARNLRTFLSFHAQSIVSTHGMALQDLWLHKPLAPISPGLPNALGIDRHAEAWALFALQHRIKSLIARNTTSKSSIARHTAKEYTFPDMLTPYDSGFGLTTHFASIISMCCGNIDEIETEIRKEFSPSDAVNDDLDQSQKSIGLLSILRSFLSMKVTKQASISQRFDSKAHEIHMAILQQLFVKFAQYEVIQQMYPHLWIIIQETMENASRTGHRVGRNGFARLCVPRCNSTRFKKGQFDPSLSPAFYFYEYAVGRVSEKWQREIENAPAYSSFVPDRTECLQIVRSIRLCNDMKPTQGQAKIFMTRKPEQASLPADHLLVRSYRSLVLEPDLETSNSFFFTYVLDDIREDPRAFRFLGYFLRFLETSSRMTMAQRKHNHVRYGPCDVDYDRLMHSKKALRFPLIYKAAVGGSAEVISCSKSDFDYSDEVFPLINEALLSEVTDDRWPAWFRNRLLNYL